MIAKLPFEQAFPAATIEKLPLPQKLFVLWIMRGMYNQENSLRYVVRDTGAVNGKIPIINVENDITGTPIPNNSSFCGFNNVGDIKISGDWIELRPFSHKGSLNPCEEINTILQGSMMPTTKAMLNSPVFAAGMDVFAKKARRALLQTVHFGDLAIDSRSWVTPEIAQAFGAYDGHIIQAMKYLQAPANNATGQIVTGIAGNTLNPGSGAAIGLVDQVWEANPHLQNYNTADLIMECSGDFFKALSKDVSASTGFGTNQPRLDLTKGTFLVEYGGLEVVVNPAWSDLYRTYNPTIPINTAHLAVIRPKNTFRMGLEGAAADTFGVMNYYNEDESLKSKVNLEAMAVHGAKVVLPETISMIM